MGKAPVKKKGRENGSRLEQSSDCNADLTPMKKSKERRENGRKRGRWEGREERRKGERKGRREKGREEGREGREGRKEDNPPKG